MLVLVFAVHNKYALGIPLYIEVTLLILFAPPLILMGCDALNRKKYESRIIQESALSGIDLDPKLKERIMDIPIPRKLPDRQEAEREDALPKDVLESFYLQIDKRITQEDELFNSRLNFFFLAETFLIIPYFQVLSAWPENNNALLCLIEIKPQTFTLLIICALGTITSTIFLPTIRMSIQALGYYKALWKLIKLRYFKKLEQGHLDELEQTNQHGEQCLQEKLIKVESYDAELRFARIPIWFDLSKARGLAKHLELMYWSPLVFFLIWIFLAFMALFLTR